MKKYFALISIACITLSICLLISNNAALKIKLLSYANIKYYQLFKHKLDSHFNDRELLFAIDHARQESWVQAQIAADLAPFQNGIAAEQVEYWFSGLQAGHKHNDLIKFSILDGKVITDPRSDRSYNAAYVTILEILHILVQKNLISNCEFIIVLSDFLTYIPPAMNADPIAVLSFAKHSLLPVEKHTILVPDWVNVRSGAELRNRIRLAAKVYPWSKKQTLLHWRGGNADSMQHRQKLIALSNKLPFLDVGMTLGEHAVMPVEPEFSIKNKYQIALDGARCTWSRMLWQMQANTLMIKPYSPQVQWFSRGLQPFINYLPIPDVDEASISAAFTWLQEHEAQTQAIIHNANVFADNNFKTQDMIAYYAVLLQEYAKLYKSS